MSTLFELLFVVIITVFTMRWVMSPLVKFYFLPRNDIKKDLSLRPKVTVILPCFNEGEHVYETIRSLNAVDYPEDKFEIIAIDDCSQDDSLSWMKKAQQEFTRFKVIVDRNAVNSGKHKSLVHGLSMSTGEIIICTDSDATYKEDCIIQLVSCFADPHIGAVGGRIGVSNVNDNVLTKCQALIYYYGFNLYKVPESFFRSVFCISGCLFAIRREIFEKIETSVSGRNWFGSKVKGGEDRYMTHLVLLEGYGTYVNADAQCWTKVPDNVKQLYSQQLRWRRSGLMNLFWTLRNIGDNFRRLNPLALWYLIVPSFLTVTWPFIYWYFSMNGFLSYVSDRAFVYCLVFSIIAALANMVMRKHNKEQIIDGVLYVPLIGLWLIIDKLFITAMALLTFDADGWETRNK